MRRKRTIIVLFLVIILCVVASAERATAQHGKTGVGDYVKNILPLRERVRITEGFWQWRKEHVLPIVMREQGVDMWIIRDNEADKFYNNEGPIFSSLVPADLRGMIFDSEHGDARPVFLMFYDTGSEIEYIDPRGESVPGERRQADHGFIHIGFQSNDVRGDYQRLLQQGVQFFSEPIEFRPAVWIVYFRGPDGEVGELRETPGGKTSS